MEKRFLAHSSLKQREIVMDKLKILKDDVEFITKTSARILDVLQRTSLGGSLSPEEENLLKVLQDKVRSSRHEFSGVSDDFFSWHNEITRRARESR